MEKAIHSEAQISGLFGFSHCASFDSFFPWLDKTSGERVDLMVREMSALGANSFRPHIHWNRIEPVVARASLKPEDVKPEMVNRYISETADELWGPHDTMVESLCRAGIEPHLVVGAGYDFQLPVFRDQRDVPRKALPHLMGKDNYLGAVYLHVRAVVRRYRKTVRIWQVENELNVAPETALFARWRSGRAWLDRGFLRCLMEVLNRAVKDSDPGAFISHNFHTDVRILPKFYSWREDIRRWLHLVDLVGVDAFPNYLIGVPVRGAVVGRTVSQAAIVSDGKPVMVLESGYPVRPRYRGFTESRQREFIKAAVSSSIEAGCAGFYYYCLCSSEGFPVCGPWSNRFLQSVEPWWGLIRNKGSRRPGWNDCREVYSTAMKNRTPSDRA